MVDGGACINGHAGRGLGCGVGGKAELITLKRIYHIQTNVPTEPSPWRFGYGVHGVARCALDVKRVAGYLRKMIQLAKP